MADLTNIIGNFNPAQYVGKRAYTTTEPPRIAAIKEMREYGLVPPSSIPAMGEIFRFKCSTDKGRDESAWAIYYEYMADDDLIGICVFGSWKGNPDKVVWSSKLPEYMTTGEKNELNQYIEHSRETADKEKAESQIKTAKECKALWEKMPAIGSTEYTQRKKIKPYNARSNNGVLCVPVMYANELVSLQYIADDGSKKFHSGGRTKGGYCHIEGANKDKIYIVEGYATGCSIAEATNCDVYVCFNAQNIYEFCAYIKEKVSGVEVIIAADDDHKTDGNPGITKGKNAADSFGFSIVIPDFKGSTERGTDFNDVHCLMGIDALKKQLSYKKPTPRKNDVPISQPKAVDDVPPGVIGDIYRFYMATSGNYQPGFAIQTALAVTSTMCSRYFITDNDNMATMFFLNVGKTATGKEHCKKVVEHVFRACKLDHLVAGDGFTSSAAVMSLLLEKAQCVSVIDEFGRYLEAAGDNKGGMQKEANTTLMESVGRPDGTLRPKNYSSMTLSKEQSDAMKDRVIHCPAITLYGLTTPNTFFDNIKMTSVLDGFLNRFIVHVSDAVRSPRKRTSMIDVPQSICEWANAIRHEVKKLNSLEISSEIPDRKRIYFSEKANDVQKEFEIEMIGLQNELESVRLDGLPARANEWAMRLSLCLALSRDPKTTSISDKDMEWSCNYMRQSVERMIIEVRKSMSETEVEAAKKHVYQCIKLYQKGVTWAEMQGTSTFMQYRQRDLKDYLQSLLDAELIEVVPERTKGKGRPTNKYKAVEGASIS